MKRNSTLVCKVLLATITIFSLNFNTVSAQTVAPVMAFENASFVAGTTSVIDAQYEFPAIAPGIDAYITISNKVTTTAQANATDNKLVNIKWITELEQGDGHFEVERSFDNIHFKTIAIVLDGFLTGTVQKTYLFKDHATELKGRTTVYYRLKQLDPAGNGTSCKLLTVSLNSKAPVAAGQTMLSKQSTIISENQKATKS